MKLIPGTLIQARYEILAEIGEGGFATVFLARDTQLGRDVAIKVLKVSPFSEDISRFQREAKLLAQLSHRNIVAVYAFDLLNDSTPFIVMEYLHGQSLSRKLVGSSGLNQQTVALVLRQCCEGLSYAHHAGVVHRDLSPSNMSIEIENNGSCVKLLDFGLSKIFVGESGKGATLTETGMLMGNPPYMSPEQARGTKVDNRSDIYALGCILYQCLSGKTPFTADSVLEMIFSHQNDYPEEPVFDWQDPEAEAVFKAITLRCMQKDPDKRFQSCDEILLALDSKDSKRAARAETNTGSWMKKAAVKSFGSVYKLPLTVFSSVVFIVVLSAYVFPEHLAGTIVNTFTALPVGSLGSVELSLVALMDKHNKPQLAIKLLKYLEKGYLAKNNIEKLPLIYFAESDSFARQSDWKKASAALQKSMDSIEQCPDSNTKVALLRDELRRVQDLGKYGTEQGLYLSLHCHILNQLLDSKGSSKAELNRIFLEISKRENALSVLNSNDVAFLAKVVIKFLHKVRTKFGDSESGFLFAVCNSCQNARRPDLQFELYRLRLSLADSTGESKPDIANKMAIALSYSKPDEALRLLQESLSYDDVDVLEKGRAWSQQAFVYFDLKKDYVSALNAAQKGLDLMASVPLISLERSRNFKINLLQYKIYSLFKLGRQNEMKIASENMVQGLLENTPGFALSSAVEGPAQLGDKAISRGAPGNDTTLDELVHRYLDDRSSGAIECLVKTKQEALCKDFLLEILALVKKEHWALDVECQGQFNSLLTKISNPELVAVVRNLLEQAETKKH